MGEQLEKKFVWVLKKFSSLQEDEYESRLFTAAGCNWRLIACPKGEGDGYLSLYLKLVDPESLPPRWRREVNFSLTVVSKRGGKSNKVLGGQCFFDKKNATWGHNKFMSLTKLHAKGGGFLVKNRLIVVAELQVFLPVVVPKGKVSITGPLSSKDESQADDVSTGKSQRDSSCQVAQENEDTKLVDDDGASEEDSDYVTSNGSFEEDMDNDGVSSRCLDEGGEDRSLLDQSSALEDATHTAENHGIKSNSVRAESAVSNDDALKEDVADEASSLVSNGSSRNGTSLHQVKSLEDASRMIENGGRGFSSDTSVTETADNMLTAIQPEPAKETMNVNGFDVLSSQVESVKLIFERHPDIAVEFNAKNQQLKNACMNFLLSILQTLCQSLEKLSSEDLVEADIALTYLKDAGFKVDWLEKKLDQLKDKKEKEQFGLARLQEIEENLLKLKQKCSELDALAEEEKAELSATRTALSFDDLV